MKAILAILMLGLVASAYAEESYDMEDGSARFLYFNTSSTATSLTLLGALILLGVIFYLVYVGGLLNTNSYNRNDYAYDQQYNYDYQQAQYRSANDGYDFNSLNIIQWISMLQDMYEKFDYNDLDCQKRLICEVMREPEVYGNMAMKFKNGFQYAKYLEVLSLPDDMRELLDEYLDANARSTGQKDCMDFFQCPYSIRDSFKTNVLGNSL